MLHVGLMRCLRHAQVFKRAPDGLGVRPNRDGGVREVVEPSGMAVGGVPQAGAANPEGSRPEV